MPFAVEQFLQVLEFSFFPINILYWCQQIPGMWFGTFILPVKCLHGKCFSDNLVMRDRAPFFDHVSFLHVSMDARQYKASWNLVSRPRDAT